MWEVSDQKLLNEVRSYLEKTLGTKVEEKFVLEVYADVCLSRGYEEAGVYSMDDIALCAKRSIVELINENYQ